MREPRIRFTIRRMMGLVIWAAFVCACITTLYRWEARRALMYHRRDVTRSIMLEAEQDIVAAGRSASEFRVQRPVATYTAHWTQWLEVSEKVSGLNRPLIRATVSCENGFFSLQPIIVETYGSPLDAPWLDRLLRIYRENGWRYKLIQAPDSEYFRRRQEWVMDEKL